MIRFGSATLLLAALAAPLAQAQSDAAQEVLDRFHHLRPSATDLAMYRLDWVPSLEQAKQRARNEDRPIVVVAIHARYGDLFSGHC